MEPETALVASLEEILSDATQSFMEGKTEQADRSSLRLLALMPQHALGLFLRGMILNETGQHQQSIPFLENAIAEDPANFSFHHYLGTVWQRLNDQLRAKYCLRKALRLCPDDEDMLLDLGNTLREVVLFDESISCFERILKMNPSNAMASHGLGQVFEEMGQTESAIRSLDKLAKRHSWGRCRAGQGLSFPNSNAFSLL